MTTRLAFDRVTTPSGVEVRFPPAASIAHLRDLADLAAELLRIAGEPGREEASVPIIVALTVPAGPDLYGLISHRSITEAVGHALAAARVAQPVADATKAEVPA